MSTTLTDEQLEKALRLLEHYLGVTIDRDNRPHQGTSPLFLKEWRYTEHVRPALIWEGGPFEWDCITFNDEGATLREALRDIGIYIESYSSWAICFYPLP